MRYEYVESGVAHSRVTYTSVFNFPHVVDAVKRSIREMQGRNNHLFSFLYNAYTEDAIGENFNKFYREDLNNIYSDSGGLQAVTRGHNIDSSMKNKVYESQGKYSTIAMSFDEIPVKVEGKSERGEIHNRSFDPEYFQHTAEASAFNLEEQIDNFLNRKVVTKPLMIVQGNNVDYFCRWVDIILKNIPKEKHEFIAGLSISGASIGTGAIEDVERLFSFSEIQAPDYMKKHLHLLGVGSIDRLLPLAAFVHSGLFPEDLLVSYDSTTHSSSVTMGRYFREDGKAIDYGRSDYKVMDEVITGILNRFPGYIDDIDRNLAYIIMTTARKEIFAKYTEHDIEYYYHNLYNLLTLYSIDNFTANVNKITDSKSNFKNRCYTRKYNYLVPLLDVKNKDDYQYWYHNMLPYVKSKRIQEVNPASVTLDDFL